LQVGCHKKVINLTHARLIAIQNQWDLTRMRKFDDLFCDNRPANQCNDNQLENPCSQYMLDVYVMRMYMCTCMIKNYHQNKNYPSLFCDNQTENPCRSPCR
jgi:hypothetical protein